MTIVTITLNPCIDKTVSVAQVLPDCKLSCHNIRTYPGGGGINVARVIDRLGVDVSAYWCCGGEAGQRLAGLLDTENVPHIPVSISAPTRENLIVQEEKSGNLFRFGMPGPVLSDAERQCWKQHIRQLPPSVHYLIFSGSLPEGFPAKWFAELLQEVPRRVRVVVDTKRDALRQALNVGVYLIKPNVRELEELVERALPDDATIEQAAREIIQRRGAEVVIVSLGRAGILLATSECMVRIAAPSVRLQSKVGAGDAVVGGIVAALVKGQPLPEAAKFGVAAGAAAVTTEGTELCHRADVEQLFDRM